MRKQYRNEKRENPDTLQTPQSERHPKRLAARVCGARHGPVPPDRGDDLLRLAREFDRYRPSDHVGIWQHSPISVAGKIVLPATFFEEEICLIVLVGQDPPSVVSISGQMIELRFSAGTNHVIGGKPLHQLPGICFFGGNLNDRAFFLKATRDEIDASGYEDRK